MEFMSYCAQLKLTECKWRKLQCYISIYNHLKYAWQSAYKEQLYNAFCIYIFGEDGSELSVRSDNTVYFRRPINDDIM